MDWDDLGGLILGALILAFLCLAIYGVHAAWVHDTEQTKLGKECVERGGKPVYKESEYLGCLGGKVEAGR